MYPSTLRIAAATIAVLTTVSTASAALICGAVQMRHFGIHDNNFRLAKNWARLLPHTTAHEGAVVVQYRKGRDSAGNPGGHVSRIERITGSCTAIVADEKGHYERDICKRLIAYVDPNGNATNPVASISHPTLASTRHFSAKSKRHRKVQAEPAFVPVDHLMIH